MIPYMNVRGNQWAEWWWRREASGLGFPKESPYTRLQARGGNGYQLTTDEAAWEFHRAVHSLSEDLQKAMLAFYINKGTIEQRAKDCGCSQVYLYRLVDRAHVQILGWLNDEAAGVHHAMYANTSCIRLKESV